MLYNKLVFLPMCVFCSPTRYIVACAMSKEDNEPPPKISQYFKAMRYIIENDDKMQMDWSGSLFEILICSLVYAGAYAVIGGYL